jgi:hypothetical protein
MLLDGGMKKSYANDNEPNSWRSIGWQAALIVNRLRCHSQLLELASEQKEEREEKPEPENDTKERPAYDREYVEHRLREIAAWERKQRGGNF